MFNFIFYMESLKKILPLVLVAVIFAVGGYFIGRGNLSDQGAALYKGTSTLNPCDNSPVNPCPPETVKVNNTCPEGTMFIRGKCVPLTFIKASVETSVGMKMSAEEWAAWCKSRGLVLNADGSCSRPMATSPSSGTKN
jgi:hypothetical protein